MLVIRDIDDELMQRLRERAAELGCSVEKVVCRILRDELLDDIELQLPERTMPRDPPEFS